jgi:hypothetical protein
LIDEGEMEKLKREASLRISFGSKLKGAGGTGREAGEPMREAADRRISVDPRFQLQTLLSTIVRFTPSSLPFPFTDVAF